MRRWGWVLVAALAVGACGGSDPAVPNDPPGRPADLQEALVPLVVDPTGPESEPDRLWADDTGEGVLVGDVVVAQSRRDPRLEDVALTAHDAATGDVRWARDSAVLPVAPLAGPDHPLAATAPRTLPFLVVGSPTDGEVHGLDPATGEVAWSVDLDVDIAVPLFVADDLAVVATESYFEDDDYSSDLVALDPASGETRWTASAFDALTTDGCLTDTTVAAARSDGGVTVVDRRTGASVADESDVVPLGCVPSGVVVAGDAGAELIGPDGSSVWRTGAGTPPTAAIAAGDLVLLLGAEHLVAVDAADGAEVWRRPRDPAADVSLHPAGDVIVVGGALVGPDEVDVYDPPPELVALDPATGEVRWSAGVGPAPVDVSAAMVLGADGERVVLATADALVALALDDGTEVWRVAALDRPVAPSSSADGLLVVNGDADLAVWGSR